MKIKYLLFGFTLLLMVACKQQAPAEMKVEPVVKVSAESVDSDKGALIADYMAAWNAHKPELAASFFHEDGEYFDVSVGDSQRGRQAALDNVIKIFIQAVPDCKWEIRSEPIATNDGIAFEWTFSGTNTGDWNASNKATGKPIEFNGVSFIRFKDGKIVYQGDYYDAATLNKQLGW